jgi:NADH dehydrogenase FAD-containing subunit
MDYEVIIVGSGPVGIYTALNLVRHLKTNMGKIKFSYEMVYIIILLIGRKSQLKSK